MKLSLLILFFLSVSCQIAFCEGISSEVSLVSSLSELKTGSAITVSIKVSASTPFESPSGWYLYPLPKKKWLKAGSVALNTETLNIDTSQNDAGIVYINLNGRVLAAGQGTISPLEFVHEASGSRVSTSPFSVSAESIIAKKEKPQIIEQLPLIPFGKIRWQLPLAVLLLSIVLIVSALYYYLRMRRNKLTLTKDPQMAAEKTVQKLAIVYGKSRELSMEEWKQFSYQLTETIKTYLSDRFGLKALDLTDKELQSELGRHRNEIYNTKLIERIFIETSEIRYGKKVLAASIAAEHADLARKFLESNKKTKDTEANGS